MNLKTHNGAASTGEVSSKNPTSAFRRHPVEIELTPPSPVADIAQESSAFFDVTRFGADPEGLIPSTSSIQTAIDICAANGGGTVIIPSGRFLTGALWMRNNITLHLVAGATLVGSDNVADFPIRQSDWEGPNSLPMHTGVINGESLRNVALTGRGTIDGRGKVWWDWFAAGRLHAERPRLVRLINCRDVLLDGITLINSPMWTVNPLACDNVTITRLTVRNPSDSPNTDGINPESCSNVRIADCHIDVGDDCIAIKAGTEDDGRRTLKTCENITVVNCTMLHGHGGVVIGSEITGGIRNVAISNCIFSGTDRGIRIKARRGRGHFVEDIHVNNIVMDQVLCPIVVNLFYSCGVKDRRLVSDTAPHPVTSDTPSFRRFRFSNISARRVRSAAAYILGLPERGVEDMTFNNISIYMDTDNVDAEEPAMSPVAPKLCRAGFHVKHATGVRLRGVDIHEAVGDTVVLEDVADVTLRDLTVDRGQTASVSATHTRELRADNTVSLRPLNGVAGNVASMAAG